MDPDHLLSTAHALRADTRAKVPLLVLEAKYKTLRETYPYLFKIIIDKEPCSWSILEQMISSLKLIREGKKTQEEMDKAVGYELAKEFIFSHLDMSKEPELEEELEEVPLQNDYYSDTEADDF